MRYSQFKNAIRSNVGYGTGASGTFTEIYKAPSAPVAKTSYLIECDVACLDSSGVQVSVKLVKSGGTEAHVVKNAPVPSGSSIQVIDGQKIVLEPGDALQVKCETVGKAVDVIVSLVEDVNLPELPGVS